MGSPTRSLFFLVALLGSCGAFKAFGEISREMGEMGETGERGEMGGSQLGHASADLGDAAETNFGGSYGDETKLDFGKLEKQIEQEEKLIQDIANNEDTDDDWWKYTGDYKTITGSEKGKLSEDYNKGDSWKDDELSKSIQPKNNENTNDWWGDVDIETSEEEPYPFVRVRDESHGHYYAEADLDDEFETTTTLRTTTPYFWDYQSGFYGIPWGYVYAFLLVSSMSVFMLTVSIYMCIKRITRATSTPVVTRTKPLRVWSVTAPSHPTRPASDTEQLLKPTQAA